MILFVRRCRSHEKKKPFCVNWKTTSKTIQSQLLEKISIFRQNRKSLVLVIQDVFFDRLNMKQNKFDPCKDFHILTLKYQNKKLSEGYFYSYSFDEYLSAVLSVENHDLSHLIRTKIIQNQWHWHYYRLIKTLVY